MSQPDDQSRSQLGAPVSNRNHTPTPPERDHSTSQNAAVEVIRGQLDAIYAGKSGENTPHTTPVAAPQPAEQPNDNPAPIAAPQSTPASAPRPHAMKTAPPVSQSQPLNARQTTSRPQATPDQWNQYHSAWQKYYQMYYERYYANHLSAKDQEIARLEQASSRPAADETVDPQANAIKELRAQIQQKVRDSAKKVKKSHHFIPALAGICVLLVFLFLQYNRIIFGAVAAYTTPGNIDPQNIIVDASSNLAVGPDPRIIIPKINVDAPVVYGAAADVKSQNEAMKKGVAHFSIPGANAVPGQVGNTVFAAHSSNDAFASGDYKFVFAQNEKLTKGDVIYVNYQSKRYTYKVTSLEVVMPNEVSKVQIETTKPMLTLVSCVPLGTAEKRLLVFAEQISPDPASAAAPTESTQSQSQSTSIPGSPSPTLIERLFGA